MTNVPIAAQYLMAAAWAQRVHGDRCPRCGADLRSATRPGALIMAEHHARVGCRVAQHRAVAS